MTTATYSTTWEHLTSPQFQAWGSALSAAMQSCGLSQTSDTGQINWTTVAIPGVSTAAGYEIYKFTDTLQSTYPIFVKIEYGTGGTVSSTYGTPCIWLTVGEGSNGSGTLTGTLSNRVQLQAGTGGTSNGITSPSISYPTWI